MGDGEFELGATRETAIADSDGAAADDPQRIWRDVVAILQTIYDPEVPVDIYAMGLIYEVDVRAEGVVYVQMTLTTPMCPVGPMIVSNTKEAVEKVDGVELANIEMVWDPPWDMEMMSEDLRFMLGRI